MTAEISLNQRRTCVRNYGLLAPIYDGLGWMYSGGAIDASKRRHLDVLETPHKILYAGCGTAQEAVEALHRGHRVELWDSSAAMLARAEQRFSALPDDLRRQAILVQDDVRNLGVDAKFDAIVCNYFLNVFRRDEVIDWIHYFRGRLNPGGSLHIADFSPASTIFLLSPFQRLYFALPMMSFCALTRNAWHSLYDYGQMLDALHFQTTRVESFAIGKVGPNWFRYWCATPRR